MKSHRSLGLASLLLIVAGAAPLNAQVEHPWSLEARVGAVLPTGDISDNDETAGPLVGADIMYAFGPRGSVYAGGQWYRFGCDGPECTADRVGRGLDAGLKLVFSRPSRSVLPWVRGGVLLHQADIDGADSDWAPGFEAAVGLDVTVDDRFALVPAIRFMGYEAEFAQPEDDATMRFFSIDLGGHIHF